MSGQWACFNCGLRSKGRKCAKSRPEADISRLQAHALAPSNAAQGKRTNCPVSMQQAVGTLASLLKFS